MHSSRISPKATGSPTDAAVLSPTQAMAPDYNTPRCYVSRAFSPESNWCWLANRKTQVKRLAKSWKQYWFQAFPFWQFHVLFNSLFKVLFIFPSQYLFAIGLLPIFSFIWNLPYTLSCNPKQLDSMDTLSSQHRSWNRRECHPLSCRFPTDLFRIRKIEVHPTTIRCNSTD